MKTTLQSLCFAITCLAAALCLAPTPVRAQISPVGIEVEVMKKMVKMPHPGDNMIVTNETHLVITVKNITAHPLPDLTVKYWLAVRDVTTRDVTLGTANTSALALSPFGQQDITTSDVESSYQTAHRDGLKPVPESGTRYYGYGVQILQGGTVTRDVYEPTELKDLVTAAPAKAN